MLNLADFNAGVEWQVYRNDDFSCWYDVMWSAHIYTCAQTKAYYFNKLVIYLQYSQKKNEKKKEI